MKVFPAQKILFDLDGTLVDTAADLHAATNHALSIAGRPNVPLDKVQHLVGFGSLRLIQEGLSLTGGQDGIELAPLQKEFLDYYAKNLSVHSKIYEGGVEMLQNMETRGFKLAVCTNKPVAMAKAVLTDLRLIKYFGAIVGGDSLPYKKPDPRHLFDTAALLEGSGPIVMIGDSSPDILGAQAARIPAIAVSYGYADVELSSLNPDIIIESLAALPELIGYAST